jgi:hypothetical protein
MTLQTVLGTGIFWPGNTPLSGGGQTTFTAATTIDASGEYSGFVICASEAMTISHVGWRPGTVAGSPTAEIRIETVDASTGLPTGTLWGTNTNATTATLTSNTWDLTALTASATIARNDVFAVIFKYASGTSFQTIVTNTGHRQVSSLPYRVDNTGTPTASAINLASFCAALGSSGTTFYNVWGLLPISAITAVAANNTNSAAHGNRFKVPFKCRVKGLMVTITATSATEDFTVGIYTDAGSEFGSSETAYDASKMHTGSSQGNYSVPFDTSVTLEPDTWYRMAYAQTAAGGTTLVGADVPSVNYMSAMPGGVNCHYTSRSSGTWTDTSTARQILMDLWIDQLDDGVSAAGGASAFAFVG